MCAHYAWRMLSFPAAWVGAALLVLRVVVGASTIIEAALAGTEGHATLSLAVALALAVAGLALVLGYLTPLVSALIAATAAVILLGFDATILHLLASRMALFEFAVMEVYSLAKSEFVANVLRAAEAGGDA